uniref:EGF-like domain-containing protein n=1 Tax=Electrophorus electricus TaxID=8005 RepID=A0AAY5EUL7_ELEEL
MHKKLLEAQSNVSISHITSDPCSLKPCKNGATCSKNIHINQDVTVLESSRLIFVSPHYAEVYNCTCLIGFTGTKCESDIDECTENPCENGGTCYNSPGGFFCHCTEGFSGLRCSTVDNECQTVVCSNGGTCWNIQGGFFCDCRPGYEGKSVCFLALEIVDGRLRLSYDLGSGVTRLETGKPVADGSFHNITIRRTGNVGHSSSCQIFIAFISVIKVCTI